MLLAQQLGYQSCPMDGFDFDAVANIINLPKDHTIAFIIAIGKGTRESWPKPRAAAAGRGYGKQWFRLMRERKPGIKGADPV